MEILKTLIQYYDVAKLKGALALVGYRSIQWPRTISKRYNGHPLKLRIRTSDISLFQEIMLREQYNFPLAFFPQIIVDAGANCGLSAVFYATKFPTARVIAIEPEESNFAILKENVSPYANIFPVRAALWNKDGEVELTDPGNGKDAFKAAPGKGCRAISIPTLMREFNLSTIDVLKVDIEGAEKEVFENCDWINCVQFIAIELHDRFKPGCRESVGKATAGMHSFERGELTFFTR